jgi:glucose-1-phosphate adenylyltransferase
MNGTRVGAGSRLYKVIAAENVTIGDGVVLGEGSDIPNDSRPDVYREGIVTLGEGTVIPAGVSIGKNVMISGVTTAEDYPGSRLESGKTLVKEGDVE